MIAPLLFAAALSVQQSPGGSAPDDSYIRDATIRQVDYVMFHQEIDEENVDRVARLLKPGVILDLQSPGGDFRASLRFARLVRSERARVRVTGECASGCAIVWVTAPDRWVDGFTAVTFHGNPISSWDWFLAHRDRFSDADLTWAEGEASAFRTLLADAGIQPWLFQCANRLQNQRHAFIDGPGLPYQLENPRLSDRIATEEDYEMVWFPRSILEAAGVRGLDRYDPPNARQREAIETLSGTIEHRRKIYWAEDADCDPDRENTTAAPAA